MKRTKSGYLAVSIITLFSLLLCTTLAISKTATEIDSGADIAIEKLYVSTPVAKELSEIAKGILVFPDVFKAGLIVGGQQGQGALREGGKTTGYYSTLAASFGLQAGGQTFGYAMFFMNDMALNSLKNSSGWEVGVGPTIVVVDAGAAGSMSTTTAKDDIYVFFFDQKGLMAGLSLEGSKISQITPDK